MDDEFIKSLDVPELSQLGTDTRYRYRFKEVKEKKQGQEAEEATEVSGKTCEDTWPASQQTDGWKEPS